MTWTDREKRIMGEMLRRAQNKAKLNISAFQITLTEVIRLIYKFDERPASARETAGWTMRNLIPKLELIGCEVKRSSERGRGSEAVYSYTEQSISVLKGIEARGELNID